MSKKWFLSKVVYHAENKENGQIEKVTESSMFEAVSYTDAEARVMEEYVPLLVKGQELEIQDIKKPRYSGVILSDIADGIFWDAKITVYDVDENGNEKPYSEKFLIEATDIQDVIKIAEKQFEGFTSEYEVIDVRKTAIADVKPLESKFKKGDIIVNEKDSENKKLGVFDHQEGEDIYVTYLFEMEEHRSQFEDDLRPFPFIGAKECEFRKATDKEYDLISFRLKKVGLYHIPNEGVFVVTTHDN